MIWSWNHASLLASQFNQSPNHNQSLKLRNSPQEYWLETSHSLLPSWRIISTSLQARLASTLNTRRRECCLTSHLRTMHLITSKRKKKTSTSICSRGSSQCFNPREDSHSYPVLQQLTLTCTLKLKRSPTQSLIMEIPIPTLLSLSSLTHSKGSIWMESRRFSLTTQVVDPISQWTPMERARSWALEP